MKNEKNKILLILTLTPIVVTLIAIQFMSDEIIINNDVSGGATSLVSKYSTLAIPVMIILVGLVWAWIIRSFNLRYENEFDIEIKSKLEKTLDFTYKCAFGSIGIFILMQIWVLVNSF